MNAQPLQDPFAGPNYFTLSDDHFFEIYIDNDGDANEDITFQFFTGNSLRGPMVEVPFVSDEDDCVIYQRGAAPPPLTELKHGGITVSVGGRDVPIALKYAGPITAGNDGALNWDEWFRLNIVRGDRSFGSRESVTAPGGGLEFAKPFDYVGTKTFPDYESYVAQFIHTINIPGCGRSGRAFLGQREEPFFISLGAVFDLVNFVPVPGFPGAVEEDPEHNDLKGLNIDSFILEIPTECIVKPGQGGVIGAWTGVRKLHHNGEEHVPGKQVSRLGNPLVNELLIGLRDKGTFNSLEPREDIGFVDEYINYPSFPEILNILFKDAVNSVLGVNLATIAPTNFPRADLNAIFMTGIDGINKPKKVTPAEMMRLNTTIPVTPRASQSPFGVIGGDAAGYPNGRRPGDDTVDITLRAAMGRLCTLGLFCQPGDAAVGGVEFTDGAPLSALDIDPSFPYLRTPTPGSTGI
eukprot:CAMPEP_0117042002 /NCGR_PEP_ID=MMETSP0472-20121206/29282_1 /TAXON_ID=693140 ORGANISM="Tiarina fusus, Strain LIS" /NCGR_SAMPLE_ID=MMETSP0472 /ASSEMBLY_ACC=CAM_ASM_000603 /LENGTH=463 /DNA_ID=CAMNT_0004753135 /DNA_START=175 /DNA_END=1566 /DNA_ORIENTATION=-